jgi:hypothetical protein
MAVAGIVPVRRNPYVTPGHNRHLYVTPRHLYVTQRPSSISLFF